MGNLAVSPAARIALLALILLYDDKLGDRLDAHQADLRMKRLVWRHADLPRWDRFGQALILLLAMGDQE